MKKYNLLKVLGIAIIAVWILTLFVPGSQLDYTGNVVKGNISSVGIWGLFSNLSISISYFNGIAVFLVAIACFYGILTKTEVYNNFVSKVADTFKERTLVIISILFFAILGMFVSDPVILVVFMPFIYQVFKKKETDNKVILSSTIIASLIGGMANIYNSTLFTLFGLKVNTLLVVKIILLVLSVAVLIFFIAPKNFHKTIVKKTTTKSKKNGKTTKVKAETKKNSVKTIKKDEKNVNKTIYMILTLLFGCIGVNKLYAGKVKSFVLRLVFCWTLVPFILSLAEFITLLTEKADKEGKVPATSKRRDNVLFGTSLVLFVLFVIGSIIPWESLINKLTIFSDFNKTLSGLKIGSYSVFNNVIGAPIMQDAQTGSSTGVMNVFGTFALTDVAILLFILTIIIGLASKLKINDAISSVTEKVKGILPAAITAMLISIVLVIMVTTGINITISNWILSWSKGFNVITSTLASMFGSLLTADYYYFLSTIGNVFKGAIGKDYLGVTAFIMQSVHYLTMMIAPTSAMLIIGLYYLDVPFTKWFKYIWKVLLSILVIILVIAIIIYALV